MSPPCGVDPKTHHIVRGLLLLTTNPFFCCHLNTSTEIIIIQAVPGLWTSFVLTSVCKSDLNEVGTVTYSLSLASVSQMFV